MQNDTRDLAAQLGEILKSKKGMLATAESCTGGLLAGALTSVPGSSLWFDQGWITYSNQAKHVQLGVAKETLEQFGAVSEEVARQMAAGVLAMAPRASLALTTTGIAGPGGGTAGKPVGLVWFGFAQRAPSGIVVHATAHIFSGDRDAVREASVAFSLQSALELLG
ncbi:nicotinamide-nucleotide amidohydrolase family protein [Zwartia sp.]|uniref:CinA family protein n=1 Tax=Zwartia sp. TaxID=2978004 RepID=UPI002723F830|nr:nicotinamide-nucleotide amidohydrolase family protein [Zwartia sp.]MDO9023530.1 nicotinamide-nucleotide amidohydrolase family protein [Zwartia sp.]